MIEVEHGVELIGEPRVEIMADHLGVRPINHADGTLEPFSAKSRRNVVSAQIEIETRKIDIVKQRFVTFEMPRTNSLALGWSIPVRCGRDRAFIGSKADQHRFFFETLPNELAEIEFAPLTHLRRARVAEM